DYARQLVPFASGWLLTVIVWTATAIETTLGILLLTGWRPKLVGAVACLVLIVFGAAMAISLGAEAPLSYSVFSAASAAAAYAILDTTSPRDAPDALSSPGARNRRNPRGIAANPLIRFGRPLTSHLVIRREAVGEPHPHSCTCRSSETRG